MHRDGHDVRILSRDVSHELEDSQLREPVVGEVGEDFVGGGGGECDDPGGRRLGEQLEEGLRYEERAVNVDGLWWVSVLTI